MMRAAEPKFRTELKATQEMTKMMALAEPKFRMELKAIWDRVDKAGHAFVASPIEENWRLMVFARHEEINFLLREVARLKGEQSLKRDHL